jgi:uncharacterized membrane protein YbhN (UPF0104 family)
VSKKLLLNLFKYALAFGLLAWVVSKNWAPESGQGLGAVWQRYQAGEQSINGPYLAWAAGLFTAAMLLTLLRWWVLVRAQGLPLRVADAMRLGLLGFVFSTFLPGSVGGDIVKAYFLAREHSRRTVAVATVLMDRAIALWGLVWFVAVLGGGFWLAGALNGTAARPARFTVAAAGVIVAVSAAVWLLLGLLPERRARRFAGRLSTLPKVGESAAEFWRAVWMYRCRQGSVALALLMSWVGFVGFVGCFYCCAMTLVGGGAAQGMTLAGNPAHGVPSLKEHFLLVPIGLVFMAVPLFPGGAGIGELGFGLLYDWFGFAKASGVLGSLVQRVLTWVIAIGSYVAYLAIRPSAKSVAADTLVERPAGRRVEVVSAK